MFPEQENNIFDILIGHHLPLPQPEPEERINPRHLRSTQDRVNEFWKCWMRYFVPNLLPRNKWFRTRENVHIDDLVFEKRTTRGQMAVAALFTLSTLVSRLLLITFFLVPIREGRLNNDTSSVFIALKGAIPWHPTWHSSLNRRYRAITCVPSSLKARTAIHFVRLSVSTGYLVWLAGDVSLNPGPVEITCAFCFKSFKKNQAQLRCCECDCDCHLNCVGSEFEFSKTCRLCSSPQLIPLGENREEIGNSDLIASLEDVVKLRGLKCVHQNIRSLVKKVDEIRYIISKLKSGIHVLTLTESWLSSSITDAEISIPGYNIHRKDRGSKGGGVVIYTSWSWIRTTKGLSGSWCVSLPRIQERMTWSERPESRPRMVNTTGQSTSCVS